ncbi:hypothetical protein IAI18_06980 [Acetobacteraceae bacterium H6797]|nr:hypothetical protein [Acetobacteraceae bacterium H6797]
MIEDEFQEGLWAVESGDGERLALFRQEAAAHAFVDALEEAWESALTAALAATKLRFPEGFIDPSVT